MSTFQKFSGIMYATLVGATIAVGLYQFGLNGYLGSEHLPSEIKNFTTEFRSAHPRGKVSVSNEIIEKTKVQNVCGAEYDSLFSITTQDETPQYNVPGQIVVPKKDVQRLKDEYNNLKGTLNKDAVRESTAFLPENTTRVMGPANQKSYVMCMKNGMINIPFINKIGSTAQLRPMPTYQADDVVMQ